MYKLFNRLKESSFFRNIALLASGSLIAQAIAVLCSPLVTRLYSPEQIGLHSYLIAMVSIFTAIMNARYDMAIVSETEERNIYPLIKLSMLVGLTVSFVATIGFGFYFHYCKPEYAQYQYVIIFFFLILVSSAIMNVLNAYNNRTKEYKVMTSVYVIRTGCQNIGGVLLGVFKLGAFGLILPYAIGQYLGIGRQSKTLRPHFKEIWNADYESLKRVAKKHVQLPLYSTPALLANSFSFSSITIFMESLFDMTMVGYYSLSTRILGLPLSLVSGNVSKVFYQEAAQEYGNKGHFKSAFKKSFLFLLVMSIPMGLAIYILSPWACRVFFGESWVVAGECIRILTPYYMIRFIGTAIAPGFLVCNKQKNELFIQILLVFTSVLACVITVATEKSVAVFLWAICVTKSVVYLIQIILVWRNANKISESKFQLRRDSK